MAQRGKCASLSGAAQGGEEVGRRQEAVREHSGVGEGRWWMGSWAGGKGNRRQGLDLQFCRMKLLSPKQNEIAKGCSGLLRLRPPLEVA